MFFVLLLYFLFDKQISQTFIIGQLFTIIIIIIIIIIADTEYPKAAHLLLNFLRLLKLILLLLIILRGERYRLILLITITVTVTIIHNFLHTAIFLQFDISLVLTKFR